MNAISVSVIRNKWLYRKRKILKKIFYQIYDKKIYKGIQKVH